MSDKKEFGFSVLIVTYNSEWIEIQRTLQSILLQDFQDYEIIIADDGSEENHKSKIESFFKTHNFEDYTLVLNEENQGTVKNLISGLEVAKGRYVRDFGPGDMFYDERSLGDVYEFMSNNHCKACFGLIRGYYLDSSDMIKTCRYAFPFDINAYRKKNKKRIKKNLVLFTDNIVGASMCYDKKFYLYYLKKIAPNVKYLEDIFPLVAALDGHYFRLYDKYLIWYECSGGISTSHNDRFRKLLFQDRDRLNSYVCEKYGDDPLIRIRRSLNKAYTIDNPYKRVLRMSLRTPTVLFWAVRHYIQVLCGAYDSRERMDFINHIISE